MASQPYYTTMYVENFRVLMTQHDKRVELLRKMKVHVKKILDPIFQEMENKIINLGWV